jgi:hypothetical protein
MGGDTPSLVLGVYLATQSVVILRHGVCGTIKRCHRDFMSTTIVRRHSASIQITFECSQYQSIMDSTVRAELRNSR